MPVTYDHYMTAHRTVLQLNASYEPLCTVTVKRAVALILKGDAELVSAKGAQTVHSECMSMPTPSVIRLIAFRTVPKYRKANLNRRSILVRDNYTCAYCGEKKGLKDMTMDHILPRSRKGRHTWKNVVACCYPCNQRKDDHTPEEMGWKLRFKPYEPEGSRRLVLIAGSHIRPDWEEWLDMAK